MEPSLIIIDICSVPIYCKGAVEIQCFKSATQINILGEK